MSQYLPSLHPVTEPDTRLVTYPWLQFFNPTWNTHAFAAANFGTITGGVTWTVVALGQDVTVKIIGSTALVHFTINGPIAGGNSPGLTVRIPGLSPVFTNLRQPCIINDGATGLDEIGIVAIEVPSTGFTLRITRSGGANFIAGVTYVVNGSVTIQLTI